MLRRAAAGGLLLALTAAGGALAQSDRSGGPPQKRGPPNIFISPSGEPFRAAQEAPYASATWFQAADADGDGRLTRAEFLQDADRFFRRLDTDGDGVIDGFEIQAYEEKIAPEILPRIGRLRSGEGQDADLFSDRNGDVRGGGARSTRDGGDRPGASSAVTASDTTFSGAGVFGMLNEPEPVPACDTDLDGRVTLAEWRAKAERRFILLDAKGAGALTLDALPKTYVQTLRERAARRKPPPAPRR